MRGTQESRERQSTLFEHNAGRDPPGEEALSHLEKNSEKIPLNSNDAFLPPWRRSGTLSVLPDARSWENRPWEGRAEATRVVVARGLPRLPKLPIKGRRGKGEPSHKEESFRPSPPPHPLVGPGLEALSRLLLVPRGRSMAADQDADEGGHGGGQHGHAGHQRRGPGEAEKACNKKRLIDWRTDIFTLRVWGGDWKKESFL